MPFQNVQVRRDRKGKLLIGGKNSAWYNEEYEESLHPDLDHPVPIDPHWDYKDATGKNWRLYLDNTWEGK